MTDVVLICEYDDMNLKLKILNGISKGQKTNYWTIFKKMKLPIKIPIFVLKHNNITYAN
jgi:hypothetical protein